MPSRGEIYWFLVGDLAQQPFPALIVSIDDLNTEDTLLVVPLSNKDLSEKNNLKNCVYFYKNDVGLEEDYVAEAHRLSVFDRRYLLVGQGVIGKVEGPEMERVINAIRWTLGDQSLS